MTHKSVMIPGIFFTACILSSAAKGYSAESETSAFWSAGSEWGAALVIPEQESEIDGFRLYFRSLVRDRFIPSAFFAGLPQGVVMRQDRLWIIFENGNIQSYSLSADASPQPQPSLPPGLRLCSFTAGTEYLYLLVQVKSDGNVLIPCLLSDTAAENFQDTASSSDLLSSPIPTDSSQALFSPGEYLILQSSFNRHWHAIHRIPLPLSSDASHALAVHENQITVFSLSKTYPRDKSLWRDIQTSILKNGVLETQAAVPQKNLIAMFPLVLNRRLSLLEAMAPETVLQHETEHQAADLSQMNYRLAYPASPEWAYTPLLSHNADSPLTASLSQIRFAPFGQNLLAVQKISAGEFFWGVYSPQGESLIPLQRKIQALRHVPTRYWFQRYESSFPFMLLILLILFWKRREAFGAAIDPFPPFPPAPLWQRSAAFALDFLPALIAGMLLFSDSLEWIMEEQRAAFAARELIYPLGFLKLYAVSCLILIAYQMLFEIALGATPGKMIFGLRVCDLSGKRASKKQIFLRNLIKLLELHQGVFFMILVPLIITPLTQRPGDLIARTFVCRAAGPREDGMPTAKKNKPDDENQPPDL